MFSSSTAQVEIDVTVAACAPEREDCSSVESRTTYAVNPNIGIFFAKNDC